MLDLGLFMPAEETTKPKGRRKNSYAPGGLEVSKVPNKERAAAALARWVAVVKKLPTGVSFDSRMLKATLEAHFRDDKNNPIAHDDGMVRRAATAMCKAGLITKLNNQFVRERGLCYHLSVYKRVDDATPADD